MASRKKMLIICGKKRKYMKIELIYNPNSGGGRGKNLAPVIIKSLEDKGYNLNVHKTEYHEHAIKIVRHLDLTNTDILVSVGGDGTMYEVLNGLFKNEKSDKKPYFAVIPVGTGNSFSQDLNMHKWKDGLFAILNGSTKAIDIMKFNTEGEDYYSINALGIGLPSDVCITGNKHKKILGKFSYTSSALLEIIRYKAHHTILEVDGVTHEYMGAFTNFSNTRIFGGNMMISPDSVLDDGEIEAVVLLDAPKGTIIKALPTLYTGKHIDNPYVKVYKGKHFKITTNPVKVANPEGEIFGVTPLEITVMPKAIEMFYLPDKMTK